MRMRYVNAAVAEANMYLYLYLSLLLLLLLCQLSRYIRGNTFIELCKSASR